MRILLYNEHHEYELECKKRKNMHYRILIVLNGYVFMIYIFEMYVMSKQNPRIFYSLFMKCFVIGLHWRQIWWKRYEGDRRCGDFYIEV